MLRTLGVVSLLVTLAAGQWMPESPCPEVFRYVRDPGGIITVPPPRPGVTQFLRVQLFLADRLLSNYAGRISLVEDKDTVGRRIQSGSRKPVQYYVKFPVSYPIARIDRITVNNKVVCQGPAFNAPVLTRIHLEHQLFPLSDALSSNNGLDYFGGDDFDNFDTSTFTDNNNNNQGDLVPVTGSLPFGFSQSGFGDGGRPTWFVIRPPPTTTTTTTPPPPPRFGPDDFPEVEVDEPKRPIRGGRPPVASRDICGRSILPNELVINGRPTNRGEWPWIAALFITNFRGQEFLCSGTLISRKYVVTAGHCIKSRDGKQIPARDLVVYLGKYKLRRFAEPDVQAREVERTILHPDYGVSTSFDADLAVLELKAPAEYTRYVIPICLWDKPSDLESVVGRMGTVVGWGKDEFGNNTTDEPRLVEMPIVSDRKCLDSKYDFYSITSNRTLCAGFRNNTGPCNGDSGSGMVLPFREGSDSKPRWYLRGLVSVALYDKEKLSCDLSNYVVFTDLAKHSQWMSQFADN